MMVRLPISGEKLSRLNKQSQDPVRQRYAGICAVPPRFQAGTQPFTLPDIRHKADLPLWYRLMDHFLCHLELDWPLTAPPTIRPRIVPFFPSVAPTLHSAISPLQQMSGFRHVCREKLMH